MNKNDALAKGLAVTGTLLLWLPLILMLVMSGTRLIQSGRLMIDWLLPFELFPAPIVGAVLLIVAALRTHTRRGLIIGATVTAIVAAIAGMVLASVSGLASGAIGPSGPWWIATTALLAISGLAIIALAIGGVLLTIDLFRQSNTQPVSETTVPLGDEP